MPDAQCSQEQHIEQGGRDCLLLLSHKKQSVVLRATVSEAKTDGRIRLRWVFSSRTPLSDLSVLEATERQKAFPVCYSTTASPRSSFPKPTLRHSSRSISSPMPRLLLLPPLACSSPLLGQSLISTLQSHTAPVLHSAKRDELRTHTQAERPSFGAMRRCSHWCAHF